MIKLLFGLLITVFTTFLGKKLTNKFSQKYEFYKAFEKFNSTALRNLNFKNGGISEFYGDDFGNEGFNSFVTKRILGNEEISDESILPKFLNESEKKEISDYFYEIGKHNFDAERDFLERNRLFLDEKIKELKEQARRYSSLGAKLGFSVGMTTMIIIL